MEVPNRNVLRVFLASPGGLEKERERARTVVAELNQDLAGLWGWIIDLMGWEDAVPGYGRPQGIINDMVDNADVFLGLLHDRWGSPTGSGHDSGFEEEFERAIGRRRRSDAPDIVIAFKQIEDATNPGEQLKRVLAFRKGLEDSKEVLFAPTDIRSMRDWERLLRKTFYRFILRPVPSGLEQRSHGSSERTSGTRPETQVRTITSVDIKREAKWVNAYNRGADALSKGDVSRAFEQFRKADRIYQGRPEARMALGSLHWRHNSIQEAIEAYRGALDILRGPPPEGMDNQQLAQWSRDRQVAAFNASQLLAESGDFEGAAQLLQGYLDKYSGQLDPSTRLRASTALAGFHAQAGEVEVARTLYGEILNSDDLTSADYFQIGIGFFNTGDYERAAAAFRHAAELNPYSRDALLNLVQSLYSRALELEDMRHEHERSDELRDLYDQILDAAERVRDYDPLNRNLLTFMLRSLRSKTDLVSTEEAERLTRRTQDLYRTYQQQPYEVADVSLRLMDSDAVTVSGTLTNLSGRANKVVALQFALIAHSGSVIDARSVHVTVPEKGKATDFAVNLNLAGRDLAGWKYARVE